MSNEVSIPAVISDSTINANKVGALANRPTSPSGYGGHGLTSEELRRRFDNLPKLAIEALNNLILFMSAELILMVDGRELMMGGDVA